MILAGPVHIIVVGTGSSMLPEGIFNVFQTFTEGRGIRLLDAAWISKLDDGELNEVRTSDLDQEDVEFKGALAGTLFGIQSTGPDFADSAALSGLKFAATRIMGLSSDDLLEIADRIPRGTSAAILLVEHSWTVGFMDALVESGGSMIAQGFVTQQMLAGLGDRFSAEMDLEL